MVSPPHPLERPVGGVVEVESSGGSAVIRGEYYYGVLQHPSRGQGAHYLQGGVVWCGVVATTFPTLSSSL